jgi:hypothetical protein
VVTIALGQEVDWQQMDEFDVRRRGLCHWQVVCISASDGIERECAFGTRFWRRLSAERVAQALRSTMMGAFWQAGAHPYQHGAVPVVAVGGQVAPGAATTAAEA